MDRHGKRRPAPACADWFRRWALFGCLMGCLLAGPAAARPAPSLQLSFQAEAGDNLLEDSLAWSDQGLGLDLRLFQPLAERLALTAGGGWTGYSDHDELAERRVHGGILLTLPAHRLESLEARLGLSGQIHADDFSIYDQRRGSLQLAARGRPLGGLRPRGQLVVSETRFPSAPDSQQVDAREFGASLGINWAMALPLAVDLEAGSQSRRWFKLETPVVTAWHWTSLRLSRPLGTRWGLRLQLDRRWQPEPDGAELGVLGEHGLDPADLLWDGWQGEVGLQTGMAGWRVALRGSRLHADYTALPGQDGRRETRWESTASLSRTLALGAWSAGWRALVELEVARRWTDSSLPLYDVVSTRGGLRLSIASP
jgi:hypothetical protein